MEEKTINGVASAKNKTGKIPEVSVKRRHVFDKSGFKEIKNKKELKQLKEDIKSDNLIQRTDVFHDKFTLSNSKHGSEPTNPGRSDYNELIKSKKTNNIEIKHINGEASVLSEGEEVSSGFETISSNDSIADYEEIGLSLHEPEYDNYYITQEENVFSSKYRYNIETFYNENSYSFDKSDIQSQHHIKANIYPHQNYYNCRGYKQSQYYKMYSGYDKNYNYDRYKWSGDKIDEYKKEIPTNTKRKHIVEYKRSYFLKDNDRNEFVRYSNRNRCSRSRSRSSRSRSSSHKRSRSSHSGNRFNHSRSRSSHSRSKSSSHRRSRSSHSRSKSSSRRRSICHRKKKSLRNTKPSYKRNRIYRRNSSSSESSCSESSRSSYSSSNSSSSTSRGTRSPIHKAKKIQRKNGRSNKILKSNHRRNSPVKKRRRSFYKKSSLSPENKRLHISEPEVIVKKHENRCLKLLSSFPENDKIKKEKTFLEKIMKNVKIRDRSAAMISKKKEETKLWNTEVKESVKFRIRQKSNSRLCLNYVPPSFSDILLTSNVAPPSSVDVIPYNDMPSSSNYVPPSSNNVVLSLSEVSPPSNENVPSSLNNIPPSSNGAPPSSNDIPPPSNYVPPSLNDAPSSSNDVLPLSNDIPPPSSDILPSSNGAPPSSNDIPPSNDISPSTDAPPLSTDVPPSSNEAPPPNNAPPSSKEVSPSHDVSPFPNNIPFCSYTIPRYPNYIPYHPNTGRMYPWQRFPFPSTPRKSINNLPLKRGPTGLPVHITITGEVITHDMGGRPIPISPEGYYLPVDRTGRLFAHILSPRNLPIPIHMTNDGVLRLPNSEPVPYGPGHRFPVNVDGSIITIGPDSRPLGHCSNLPTLPPAECRQMSNVISTWPKRRQQLIPIIPQTPTPSAISKTNTHQSKICEKKEFNSNETQEKKTENNKMEINKNSYKETNEDELEILYEKKTNENIQKQKNNSNSNSYPGAKKLIPITFLPKKMSKEDKKFDSKPETDSKFLPDLKKDYVNKIKSLECIESILKIACDNKTEEESSTKSKDFIIQKVELAIKSLSNDDFKPPQMGRFIISKYLKQPTEETYPNISPLLKNRIKLPFLIPNQNEEKLESPPKNNVACNFLPEESSPKKKPKPRKLDKMEGKRNRGEKFHEFSLDFSVQCDFTTVIIKNLTTKVEKMETEVERLRNININLLDGFRNVHMASEKKSEELGKALLEIQEKDNEILSLKNQINEKGIKETSCA